MTVVDLRILSHRNLNKARSIKYLIYNQRFLRFFGVATEEIRKKAHQCILTNDLAGLRELMKGVTPPERMTVRDLQKYCHDCGIKYVAQKTREILLAELARIQDVSEEQSETEANV